MKKITSFLFTSTFLGSLVLCPVTLKGNDNVSYAHKLLQEVIDEIQKEDGKLKHFPYLKVQFFRVYRSIIGSFALSEESLNFTRKEMHLLGKTINEFDYLLDKTCQQRRSMLLLQEHLFLKKMQSLNHLFSKEICRYEESLSERFERAYVSVKRWAENNKVAAGVTGGAILSAVLGLAGFGMKKILFGDHDLINGDRDLIKGNQGSNTGNSSSASRTNSMTDHSLPTGTIVKGECARQRGEECGYRAAFNVNCLLLGRPDDMMDDDKYKVWKEEIRPLVVDHRIQCFVDRYNAGNVNLENIKWWIKKNQEQVDAAGYSSEVLLNESMEYIKAHFLSEKIKDSEITYEQLLFFDCKIERCERFFRWMGKNVNELIEEHKETIAQEGFAAWFNDPSDTEETFRDRIKELCYADEVTSNEIEEVLMLQLLCRDNITIISDQSSLSIQSNQAVCYPQLLREDEEEQHICEKIQNYRLYGTAQGVILNLNNYHWIAVYLYKEGAEYRAMAVDSLGSDRTNDDRVKNLVKLFTTTALQKKEMIDAMENCLHAGQVNIDRGYSFQEGLNEFLDRFSTRTLNEVVGDEMANYPEESEKISNILIEKQDEITHSVGASFKGKLKKWIGQADDAVRETFKNNLKEMYFRKALNNLNKAINTALNKKFFDAKNGAFKDFYAWMENLYEKVREFFKDEKFKAWFSRDNDFNDGQYQDISLKDFETLDSYVEEYKSRVSGS